MSGPSADRQSGGRSLRQTFRAVRQTLRSGARANPGTVLCSVAVFLVGATTTFDAMRRVVWPGLQADLNGAAVDVVAVTPWAIIRLQLWAAGLVGAALAAETLAYGVRGSVLPAQWGRGGRLPRWTRVGLVGLGAVVLPVGAAAGYEYVFPVVFGALADPGAAWSVVRWAGLAVHVSLAAGVAVQLAAVGGAEWLTRFGLPE